MKSTSTSFLKALLNITVSTVFAVAVAPASADVILTTGNTYSAHEALLGRNVLSKVLVGAADVAIGGFATKGTLQANGNIEFVIFDGAGSGLTPAYKSAILAENASGDVWWDSPIFNFTLLANHTYQFGLIADKTFSYDWNGASDITSNGLTAYGGSNGNANGNLTSPMTTGGGGVQQSLQIFSPRVANVPEPTSVALLGLGLLGLLAMRRRGA